jgi:hypothetical protein
LDDSAHFHYQSRYLELQLLLKRDEKYLHETTEMLLEKLDNKTDDWMLLAYTGRWCRGLLYTGLHLELKNNHAWKNHCMKVFYLPQRDLEFKATVYVFLKLVYGERLPLGFFINNHWDNALVESQLMLSMAFGNEKAVNAYKKYLGISLELGT